MSSYVAAGNNLQYVLPFQMDAVPSSFKSNLAPRPINCVLQTTVVPSTSGNATLGGTTTIQVPLGQSAYICNPYLRFRVTYTTDGGVTGARFKGASQSAMSLIASYQSSINSTLIDNIQNYGQLADCILSHSSSKEWLNADGAVLMATAAVDSAVADVDNLGPAFDGVIADGNSETFCVPLLGLLSAGGQAFPAWCVSGVLSLNINWTQAVYNAINKSGGSNITNLTFSNVNFVYDRVAVEGDFIAKMKSDMASTGAKYTYSFTNYQTVTSTGVQGTLTNNTGINVSSLRGVVAVPILTAVTAASTGWPQPMGITNFQLTLDGRMVNSTILDATTAPSVVFQELQKCFSRSFDASVTDNTSRLQFSGAAAGTNGAKSFAVGVSTCRVAEGLAFQGSPVSVAGIQMTSSFASANDHTIYFIFISDYSLLIGADGMCDIVR